MADLFKDFINKLGKARDEISNFKTDENLLKSQIEKTTAATQAAAVAQEKLNKATLDGSKAADALAAADRNASASLKEVSKNADDAAEKVKRLADQVKGYAKNALSGLQSGNLATMFGGNAAIGLLQTAHDRMQGLNKELIIYGGATRDVATSLRGHSAALQTYRQDMINVGKTMGISTDQAVAYANSLMKIGFSQETVNSSVTIAGNKFKTLSAIQAASISAGLDMAEGMDSVAASALELGDSMPTAIANITMIGTAAKNAGTSARFLSPIIKGLQSDFRFFGLESQKATDFIAKAAVGSKTAKVDMETMAQAMKGLKGAAPGVQAYYGMGSSAIGKGKGAVASSIQFEEALAGRGAGLDKALEAVTKRLGQVGGMGGQLVTRSMAAAGGEKESNAYFRQRAMIQNTMGMSQDQAGKFIEIMGNVRDQGGVADEKQKAQLEALKKTETEWAADTYKIEDEMKQKMDTLMNDLAPAGGSIKSLLEGMSATTMAVLSIGTNIVTAVLGAAGAQGMGKLLSGIFKGGGAGGVGKELTKGVGDASLRGLRGAERQAAKKALEKTGSKGALKVLGAGLKAAPLIGGVVEGGMTAWDVAHAKTGREKVGAIVGSQKGGLGGAASGALKYGAMGAAIGTVVPGVGTLIGGAVGAGVGAIAGGVGGDRMNKWWSSMFSKDKAKEKEELDRKEIEDLKEKIKAGQAAIDMQVGTTDAQRELKSEVESLKKTLAELELQEKLKLRGQDLLKQEKGVSNFQESLSKAGFGKQDESAVKSFLGGNTKALGDLNSEQLAKVQSILDAPIPKTAKGGIALSSQIREIGEAGPEAIIPLDRLSEIMQQTSPFAAMAKQSAASMGAATAFGSGGTKGRRGETITQDIKIRLEGDGILAGFRKEIILCVEDGIVKGTRKTEHAIVR